MNPFEIERGESFIIGDSDLRELLDRPYKSGYGMILFCYKGTANISVDLSRWDIRRNTVIVLIPDTILTLNASSEDFKVQYISFSKVLFDEAVFRLDPPFFRFIKDSPCYTHPADQEETINVIIRLFWLIYMDRNNVYRDMIVKNQLQCFFLNMYDKTRYSFSSRQQNGCNRGEELFHKFINCIHAHYLDQKEVSFYANELCISPRYLSPLSLHYHPASGGRVGEDHYRPAYHIGDKGVVAYHGNDRAGDNEPLELSQPILSGTVFQEAYRGVTHRVSNEKEVICLFVDMVDS